MSNLKTDEDDDFITSASPETEPDEADAAFDAKEKKKKQSNIISRIILIICACIFVFAAVKLVSILLEYKKGNDIYIILKAMSLMIHRLILQLMMMKHLR